ncbi:hypothetical protein PPL_02241 [Heterostelium album PN500]|uniref:Uncharacterized protein n=1 Tax=Heterostelium pallidum (strain ATCC 26659 / Pp 5 / PN500) TaxID=670386 RepID=D3B1R7_HETP5|nr:hypothetical protein PPL_02241 [Heterostelium album PN500]EFA85241.1 hypothetical protein PPL_02241 [Heterostelium album PN500]|eukprot:XP_020437350.1 hypothetical protein PPL_02241 [Heterostelium album PN500]
MNIGRMSVPFIQASQQIQPNYNYFSRTDIPCYSTRLNKKLVEDSTTQRLIAYLNSGLESSIHFALNALLSRSYQEKLTFTPPLKVVDIAAGHPSSTLLDAIIESVVKFEKKEDTTNNNDNDVTMEPTTTTTEYIMKISDNEEIIGKVVAILRNSILVQPNDQIIAQHATAITFLVEILYNHFKFRSSLLENSDDDKQKEKQKQKEGVVSNTTRYILEIISKIAKKLPLRTEESVRSSSGATITDNDLNHLTFNGAQLSMLKTTPPGLSKKILETLEMALFVYDNDEALLAAMETLDIITRSKATREQVDLILLKPIYEPLFETVTTTTTASSSSPSSSLEQQPTTTTTIATTSSPSTSSISTSSSTHTDSQSINTSQTSGEMMSLDSNNNSNNTPIVTTTTTTLQLKQQVTFEKRTMVERLIELLGHYANDIQLLSLNILCNLIKISQKSRIMICHCPGLLRHLCNLLAYKTGDHNMEMGKKAAAFLSQVSKEPLNLPALMPFEPTLAQIGLTDNPHTDVIISILIKYIK